MLILAIDPGPTQSAWVIWDASAEQVTASAIEPNETVLSQLQRLSGVSADRLVIEQIASYGMAVGAEVFETCVWTGRFMQAWERQCMGHGQIPPADRLTRMAVKMHLCGHPRAKDPNIRQALIDRFGPVGTKKAPGKLYGIASHLWAALAVAVAWWDLSGNAQEATSRASA